MLADGERFGQRFAEARTAMFYREVAVAGARRVGRGRGHAIQRLAITRFLGRAIAMSCQSRPRAVEGASVGDGAACSLWRRHERTTSVGSRRRTPRRRWRAADSRAWLCDDRRRSDSRRLRGRVELSVRLVAMASSAVCRELGGVWERRRFGPSARCGGISWHAAQFWQMSQRPSLSLCPRESWRWTRRRWLELRRPLDHQGS